MANFPTSKIELHQWANSILLCVVGFFAVQTYMVITADHEKLATHETRITVSEGNITNSRSDINFLTGRVNALSDLYGKIECKKDK